MAIIYSYPLTTPKVKDLLIGTSVFDEDDDNSPRNNPTVSFTIKSLLDMIGTGGFQNLQQVTNLGASTTNAITIANGLSVNGTFTDSSGGVGAAGQILSSTNIGTAWISDNAGLNYYVTGGSFDDQTGDLAITGNNALVGANINLDGRYLQGTGLATKIAFWDNTTSLSFDTNLQWIDQGAGFDDYLMIDNKVVAPALSTKGIKIFADSAGGQIHGGRPLTVNPLYYRANRHYWLTKLSSSTPTSYKTTMQLSHEGILSLRESTGTFSIHSNVAYNLSASQEMQILFSARYNIAGNEQYVAGIEASKLNTIDGDKAGQISFYTSATDGTWTNRLKLSDTSVLISNNYLELSNYGSGTVTGTSTYNLSVDSTGKVIETANVVSGVTSVNSSPLFAYKGILVTPTTGAVVVGLNINDLPVLPASIADEDVMVIVDDPSGASAGVKNHKTTVGDLKTHINTNWYVTGGSFNTSNGDLSITGNNAAVGATIDLDGRYMSSLTTTGTTGLSTFDAATGILNVPNYTLTEIDTLQSVCTRASTTDTSITMTGTGVNGYLYVTGNTGPSSPTYNQGFAVGYNNSAGSSETEMYFNTYLQTAGDNDGKYNSNINRRMRLGISVTPNIIDTSTETAVSPTTAGSGYTAGTVSVTGGGGSGMQITITVDGSGGILTGALAVEGINYVAADVGQVVTVGGTGTSGTFTLVLSPFDTRLTKTYGNGKLELYGSGATVGTPYITLPIAAGGINSLVKRTSAGGNTSTEFTDTLSYNETNATLAILPASGTVSEIQMKSANNSIWKLTISNSGALVIDGPF